jgi:alpha-tubulin suppressor-like RCC1 family protein
MFGRFQRFVLGISAVLALSACSEDFAAESITGPDAEPAASVLSASGASAVRVTNVQATSGRQYTALAGAMADAQAVYGDRNSHYENVPSFVQGLTLIRTRNSDQNSTGTRFLSFDVDRPVRVYVAYHGTRPPAWMTSAGFNSTGRSVVVVRDTDGARLRYHLYAKNFEAGRVTLGGNRDSGSDGKAMYGVMVEATAADPQLVFVNNVSAASGRLYTPVPGGLHNQAAAYGDRHSHFEEVPASLIGQTYLRTRNNDQASSGNKAFVSFDIDRPATVYVAYHGTQPPAWMAGGGFVATGERVVVVRDTDGARLRFQLYARNFEAGPVTLGSNRDAGSDGVSMYTVIFKANGNAPPQASRFISAGFHHTCALDNVGRAYCWGDNNDRGQLGDGTFTSRLTPTAVVGGHTFRTISAGAYHTCGLTAAGDAYCWGKNDYGQLGNGNFTNNNQPVRVHGQTFTQINAGGYSTCGLATDGRAYCWGRNNRGQLGNNEPVSFVTSTPVAVAGGRSYNVLSVGFEHVCGVASGGAAYCWGKNSNGQLGDGSTTTRLAPVLVQGGLTFTTVSVTGAGTGQPGHGQNHSCGLAVDGKAYCWGDNWHNNLGINQSRGNRSRPVAVKGVPHFTDIGTGGDHSCGVTSAGEAWCWGDNLQGQLGNGERTDYHQAIRVGGGHAFSRIAVGWDHTCGWTNGGQLFCWGLNNHGQIGDGSRINRNRPVAVRMP